MNDVIADSLFGRLFDDAERARWRMEDIAFDRIDRAQVTPPLIALVKDIVFGELTTMTATRRFLTELANDVDFTQWLSVWFYEETKHPQVLLRWLHHVGASVDEQFMRRGHVAAPFMKSTIGMLVTNVISEMTASAGYRSLAQQISEPVLADIADKLAADEARHAASFYVYAQRYLSRSQDPIADRRDALKVLYVWLQDNGSVRHPVNEVRARATDDTLPIHDSMPRERIVQLVGALVDLPLNGETDLLAQIRDLGTLPTYGREAR